MSLPKLSLPIFYQRDLERHQQWFRKHAAEYGMDINDPRYAEIIDEWIKQHD